MRESLVVTLANVILAILSILAILLGFRLPRGSIVNSCLLSEQDIQDVQDVQDEEACGSPSVSLVMKPLILAILSVLAILLRIGRS